MFRNLTDFKYKRSIWEAVGFYLAYFLLAMVVSVMISGILGPFSNSKPSEFGTAIGISIGAISSFLLSILIIREKKLWKNFLYLLLAFATGILSLYGGGLLGLIFPSYLSTIKAKEK
jgi:hypothetical protein